MPVIPASVFVMDRSGTTTTGVVSVAVLLDRLESVPFVPSSEIVTVLERLLKPASKFESTVIAKVTVPLAPAARLAMVNLYWLEVPTFCHPLVEDEIGRAHV